MACTTSSHGGLGAHAGVVRGDDDEAALGQGQGTLPVELKGLLVGGGALPIATSGAVGPSDGAEGLVGPQGIRVGDQGKGGGGQGLAVDVLGDVVDSAHGHAGGEGPQARDGGAVQVLGFDEVAHSVRGDVGRGLVEAVGGDVEVDIVGILASHGSAELGLAHAIAAGRGLGLRLGLGRRHKRGRGQAEETDELGDHFVGFLCPA
ncbi:hypothetical protein PoMZ_10345 [Pyricularia oryzae]|uniref:Uncharacterized protein n=1 Tax=Pyricularia oryzae TaxID=318829 RepID=A0A4P7MX38_PYROR|nr:hypothetical protein PoMZ_10345 [Pyricularia oryzae]